MRWCWHRAVTSCEDFVLQALGWGCWPLLDAWPHYRGCACKCQIQHQTMQTLSTAQVPALHDLGTSNWSWVLASDDMAGSIRASSQPTSGFKE